MVMHLKFAVADVADLDDDTWTETLTGEWMIQFYAPWCPACNSLKPTWNELANACLSEDLCQVGKVDVIKFPALSGRFMVTALPTIYHVKDGEFRQYRGARDLTHILNFIKKETWKEVEVVSAWKHPNSIQMDLIAKFFKLAMQVRMFQEHLIERFNIPMWATYALFAVATIVIGGFLGILFVCCADFFFYRGKATVERDQKEEDEDLDDDDDDIPDSQDESNSDREEDEDSSQLRKRKVASKK